MMFTSEEAAALIKLTKKVETNGKLNDSLTFDQPIPFNKRYTLGTEENKDLIFLYEINQSKKHLLKLTLYLMDDDTKIGLLRIDFSGQHKNPETVKDNVPPHFHPYAGKFFNYNEHHIHYYVEGYKTPLDWALPLTADDFPIKKIKNNNDILKAFYSFNKIINLITVFNINEKLL